MILSDAPQRELALDISKSFIVQAPAGSGKTTLLVKRYLTLLAKVKSPENIIAITFTRKAAAEMRERIIKALTGTSDDHSLKPLVSAVLTQDKQENWELLKNPKRLRVQTIDSLCLYLTQQTPVLSRFNSAANIAENAVAKQCYREAVRALIETLEDKTCYQNLQKLLLHLGNDWQYLENLLVEMLEKREQWLPHIVGLKLHSQNLRTKMEQALTNIVKENCEKCTQLFPHALIDELTKLQHFSRTNLKVAENSPCFSQRIDSTHNFFCMDLTQWQEVSKLLLTAEYQWRQKITSEHGFPAPSNAPDKANKKLYQEMKERMLALLEQFKNHEDFRQSLEDLLRSPSSNYSDNQWSIIQALLELLPLLAAQLKLIFREKNLCDYTEISMAAAQALGDADNPTDLTLTLDYRLQHLLIDEFQDTSQAQWQLLEKLVSGWNPNDGRTIFIVGDPMQSIYRFRKAEVGLFLRAQHEGIAQIKLQPILLTTNFRSQKNLITWVNNNFSKIMPMLADITAGAIPFRQSTSSDKSENPAVFYKLLTNVNENTAAKQLANICTKLLQSSDDTSIAILVKSRTHLSKIIPALRQANLTFQAVELENLNTSVVIQDLFALTRALLQPADRIAWLAILRAPWCGLKLDALFAIANGPHNTILENLNEYQNFNLDAAAQVRLKNFFAIITQQLAKRRELKLRDFIEKTWLLLQGQQCCNDQIELENAQLYFELLEQDSFDLETLPTMLAELYSNVVNNSRLQIMTIHKAKGLEFDHVIIPELQRTSRNDNKKLLMWLERPKLHQGSDLILAPIIIHENHENSIYQYCRHVEQEKNYYEIGRLLYVAVTRAKKSLYLLGRVTHHDNQIAIPKTIPAGSLLEQLKPCITPEWIKFAEKSYTEITPPSASTLRRLKTISAPLMIANNQLQNTEFSFNFLDQDIKNIGIVIHKLLEIIAHDGLVKWPIADLANKTNFIRNLMIQFGVIQLETGLQTIFQALLKTLNDETGRWILDAHQDAKCELAVTANIDNQIKHYIIDRTFIENNIRWIIDYKTGTLNQTEHQQQLQNYATLMAQLDPNHEIKLGLYNPINSQFLWIPTKN